LGAGFSEHTTDGIVNQPCKSVQALQVHMRHTDRAAAGACQPIKPPNGDFQKPVQSTAGKIAPKHQSTCLVDQLMDID